MALESSASAFDLQEAASEILVVVEPLHHLIEFRGQRFKNAVDLILG